MSIAFRAATVMTSNDVGPTTVVITKPAGTTAGDLLVVYLIQNWATATTDLPSIASVPAGWNLLATYATPTNLNKRASLYYKYAGASEPANYTFVSADPADGLSQRFATVMAAYSGVDQVNPFDVTYVEASHLLHGNTTINPNQPDITPVTPGAMVLAFLGGNATANDLTGIAAPTTPAMTLRGSSFASNTRYVAMADYLQAVAAALTIGAWTNSGTWANMQSIVLTVALRPANIPTPVVLSIGNAPMVEGVANAIAGTDFEPTGADATLAWGATAQTKIASANLLFNFTPVLGVNQYGVELPFLLTNATGLVSEGTFSAGMVPPAGVYYADIEETPAAAGLRLTANEGDLAIGWQVRWDQLQSSYGTLNTAEDPADAAVLPDGTLKWVSTLTYPLGLRASVNKGDGQGWSAYAWQTINAPVPNIPVVVGEDVVWALDIPANEPFELDLTGKAPGGPWTWTVSAGALPTTLSLSTAGVVTGSPGANQVDAATILITGAGGTDTLTLNMEVNEELAPSEGAEGLTTGDVVQDVW